MDSKIVIVDDEVHIRALLEQSLEELEEDHGVEILSAENGQEGLEVIKEVRPGLVLLDIMMPMMNGYDVCKSIREDPNLSDVKVILLTAKGQEADRERGVEVGATRYMTKPFDPDELLEIAREMLGLTA
jgi:two-component system alkaline phosphatase synthesis response regulator PhoP